MNSLHCLFWLVKYSTAEIAGHFTRFIERYHHNKKLKMKNVAGRIGKNPQGGLAVIGSIKLKQIYLNHQSKTIINFFNS